MVQRERPLDATVDIVTPESIAFSYRVAGPFRRLPAFLIDFILRIAVWIGCILLFGLLASIRLFDSYIGISFSLILLFVMEWLYGGLLETFWNGQTVGKRLMGIRVLATDGQPINGLQAMMRNILRYADMFPLIPFAAIFDEPSALPIPTFVLGLVSPVLNGKFQRLGDIVCGTMVVIDEKSWLFEAAKFEDPRVAQLAADLPASFNVTRTMARALATYVDRRQLFSPPRRREIARHVAEPLLRRFQLPEDTSYDLLLCALYHRSFLAANTTDAALPNIHAEMKKRLATEAANATPPPKASQPDAAITEPFSPQNSPFRSDAGVTDQ